MKLTTDFYSVPGLRICVELYLCLPIRLYAIERDNLTFTFTHFVHCHPQRIMQLKGVVKVKNIEATDAGVMTAKYPVFIQCGLLAAATQCQVPSVYTEGSLSSRDTVSSTQCFHSAGS